MALHHCSWMWLVVLICRLNVFVISNRGDVEGKADESAFSEKMEMMADYVDNIDQAMI